MTIGPRNSDENKVFAAEAFVVDTQFRLHQLLKAKGVSQAELAARLKLSPARVSAMFGPRPNLTLETIGRILAALDERAVLSGPTIDTRLAELAGPMFRGKAAASIGEGVHTVTRSLRSPRSAWSEVSTPVANGNVSGVNAFAVAA